MPKKIVAAVVAGMPIAVLVYFMIVDRSAGVEWLARDGRSVESFGGASVEAPVPFQGSLWSVWCSFPDDGERGGWQTTVSLDEAPCDFVSKIGLHPDYYEIGRTDGVLVSVEVLEDGRPTELWSAMFSPGLKGRREPFRPVRVSLDRWQNRQITLRMKAVPYGANAVVVICVEPRIEYRTPEVS
jgi:hypothetical protein